MKIPLCIPEIGEKELKLVSEVLKSGWLAHGPKTEEFEKNFAEYIGTKHAVSVNSCTSALQLVIQGLSLKGEIVVPSFTFVASANSIVTAGCKPVFADIEYESCNVSPESIRQIVNKKTVAIMPVHFAGQSCKMNEIMEIAEEKELEVIEDSAETIGGTFDSKKTGSFGTGCFSFYPTKNITTGEGGMITTNNAELAENIGALKGHGIKKTTFEREKETKPWLRSASVPGYNYRMSDILAAIGIEQLKKVDEMNEKRRQHASFLNKNLNFEEIETPKEEKRCKHVYQMYTIKVTGVDRTKFVLMLREKGIGASVHFDPAIHNQPAYRKGKWNLPITEKVSQEIVTLPMYPGLKKEELEYMVKSVEEVLRELKKEK